jgi:hypothetical protein
MVGTLIAERSPDTGRCPACGTNLTCVIRGADLDAARGAKEIVANPKLASGDMRLPIGKSQFHTTGIHRMLSKAHLRRFETHEAAKLPRLSVDGTAETHSTAHLIKGRS